MQGMQGIQVCKLWVGLPRASNRWLKWRLPLLRYLTLWLGCPDMGSNQRQKASGLNSSRWRPLTLAEGFQWLLYVLHIPVVPGQAGGGSFQKEKNYIAQKEFAYRMCARRPTSAMPKSFLCCERAFCRSMVVMFCALKWSVLMSWCLLRGQVMWWSRHLMRCNGLCCVMSRDAMRCHGDELYYSSTTPILLCTTPVLPCTTKYYSSTTPVLPCTTKYYSSTNLYYKVLLQYYSVPQSTIPILPCTTKYYSSTTLYCKVLLQYYSVLQSTTPILLRTTNTTLYYSSTTLYYKVPLKYYSVLQSTSWLIRITYETSFTISGATKGSLQLQQILRLPRKMNLMIDPHRIWNVIYNAQSNTQHPPTSPNTAPATQNKSHDWSTSHMKRHLQCAEQQASPSNFTKYCACHAKWISWLIHITYETSFTMRQATGITLQPHQILRLPRKMNLMIDPHHRWNVIYNARSNRHQPPTSPNTAPATQNECHDWATSQMKRHLQCAEQQATPSNLTKYCACHAKWPPNIWQKFAENRWNVISNARPIRDRSENDPRMIREWSDPENAKLNPPRRQGYFSHSPGADSIENYNVSRSGYHSKFHHMLRLPRKVTHELHQMLRLPRKVTHELHQMLRLPRKVTHELHQMLRLPRKVTHELHQMLRLPRKVTRSDTWLLLLLRLLCCYYYYY